MTTATAPVTLAEAVEQHLGDPYDTTSPTGFRAILTEGQVGQVGQAGGHAGRVSRPLAPERLTAALKGGANATPEAVTATLHLMARHMDQILPNAEPVLVDLRRGVTHRMDPAAKSADIERWLAGEAAAFTAIWTAA